MGCLYADGHCTQRNFEMKKELLLIAVVMAFIGFGLSGCSTLTPRAITNEIGGLENLAYCQFFLSKNVTLKFVSDDSQTSFGETGTVRVQRLITRDTIRIAPGTPGVLATGTEDNPVSRVGTEKDGVWYGYYFETDEDNVKWLNLSILFDEDDDNLTAFGARWDNRNRRFYIFDYAYYGGNLYSVNFIGDEPPYLLYTVTKSTRESRSERSARGRRVGR